MLAASVRLLITPVIPPRVQPKTLEKNSQFCGRANVNDSEVCALAPKLKS